MSDIDDDLLALAGGASSDEEEEEEDAPVNISKEGSATPENQKAGAKSGTKKAGRKQDDSGDEGEASFRRSSQGSNASAPMDESDSGSESLTYDAGERYPLEGKFVNGRDKSEIMAMPEIKREELLAERAAEMDTDRQNEKLRQILKSRESMSNNQDKKRKASSADLDDDKQRKTSRQRTKLGGGKVGEASTGIDSLKRARAEKDDRQRRREADKDHRNDHRNDRRDHDDYSEADADADSDVEWDNNPKAKKSPSPDLRDAEPAELIDIQRVRVGRTNFAKFCFYPGFDEAITGCFVRVNIGLDDKGLGIYRMAIVKGFTTDKPYANVGENGKVEKTTQHVLAAHGKAEKSWPFIVCSNDQFTEQEWNRYKITCAHEGVPLPTKPKLVSKIDDINKLVNRSWTEAEVQEKLSKSGALIDKFIPIERNRLNNDIKEALKRGNEALADSLRKELADLEGPKLGYGTSMHASPKKKPVTEGLSQQERLAVLNRQNRAKNSQEVRQAQINERRKNKLTEAAIARGETVVTDHSRRVITKAKVKHDINDLKPGGSGASTPAVGTPDLAAKKPANAIPYLQKLKAEQPKGIPTIRRKMNDDDVIGSLDLEIDSDLDNM
ncbi:RNA polymerase II transcription elongation factor-like protein Rtf1p [Calycina marina]|uniref:RNA polymerase II transcription elongation factor-like protein Rtf1p n=1 Tax=Calycina marina TaxID=1763456 RepID=A0A9P8CFL3_9HELO|nr:RNA polymerase II transcription elongation factor-like protein Rtf1p [Calycina marina]